MLINYGSWIENQHLFTQMPGNDATHIELLREWQARLCSDPLPDPYAFSLEFVQRFAEHTSVPGLSRLGPTLNNRLLA